MKFHRSGFAIVEWVLCIPVLIALISFVFGFLFLVLEQIQLDVLCACIAEHLAHIDIDPLLLESEALRYLKVHSHHGTALTLDRHVITERALTTAGMRPAIEIIGIELKQQPVHFSGLQLRAYSRSVRLR